MTVEYIEENGSTTVIYEGAEIAGIEPGRFDDMGSFDPTADGVTVSYGPLFEASKRFPDDAAARAWIQRNADNLRG